MKQISLFFLLAIASFAVFHNVQAKDLRTLHYSLAYPQDINPLCNVSASYGAVPFCYLPGKIPQIILRSDLNAAVLPYMIAKGMGYFLMDGASADIIETVFRPGVSSIQNPTVSDFFNKATSDFASFALGADLGIVKERFFLSLLKN